MCLYLKTIAWKTNYTKLRERLSKRFKFGLLKIYLYTESQLLIHDAKHYKDNWLWNLIHPCGISWLRMYI